MPLSRLFRPTSAPRASERDITRFILGSFNYISCRIPEDCHGYSDWVCYHGFHWFLRQTHSHPHQQHHCVSIRNLYSWLKKYPTNYFQLLFKIILESMPTKCSNLSSLRVKPRESGFVLMGFFLSPCRFRKSYCIHLISGRGN